jgi:membrane protein DedA with SNARE-associated domain
MELWARVVMLVSFFAAVKIDSLITKQRVDLEIVIIILLVMIVLLMPSKEKR